MATAAINRSVGALLATGVLLMAIGTSLHARPEPAVQDFMATIAGNATLWRLSHGLIVLVTVVLAVGALIPVVQCTLLTDR